ncbi:hypothetical protein NCCP1664_02200 [Zafaria cholistanensis]|uniref:GGDEF domain-containing protein n=1 Tax=Zafaria cholistanensis TaxID=1682741 RepID=A0A5A7NLA1_9MICC|nr:GGDEF domain-containing protein [Zafaria cholistanensis]GER21723.1 hypothetical protein NCCP1664_02200 [Zafaria cholistanensis]
MVLDTLTLRVAFGAVALTLFLLFYFDTYRRTRSAYSFWWSAAIALFLAGSSAYLLNGTIHQIWANPLGNVLAVLGAGSVWAGARSLRTVASGATTAGTWHLTAGAAGVVTVASALDTPATNNWAGGAWFLATMALMIGLSSLELWRLPSGYTRIQRPMALAAGAVAVYYLGRCVAFIIDGPRGQVFLTVFGSAQTTLLTMMLLVVVSFSMAALSNEQVTRELRTRAIRDGLTGLLNRSGFMDLAAEEMRRLDGTGTPGALVLADLDHFKAVNDRYGHAAGDQSLRTFAAACAATIRSTDLVGRYGGEEFVLLLPGAGTVQAEVVARQISRNLEDLQASADFPLPTVSYGIAPLDGGDLNAVIAAADVALYRAKAQGRNRAVLADQPLAG